MIQAVGFDFDGVLVESTEMKTRAYAQLFKDEDQKTIERIVQCHLSYEGISRFEKIKIIYQDILKRSLSKKKFQVLCEKFSALVVNEVIDAPWVAGAKEFLMAKKDSYFFFVASGTPQEELKEIIHRRGMTNFFDEIFGSPSQKDELIRRIIKKYAFLPSEIAFIGDAESDWEAAQKTGVNFIYRKCLVTSSLSDFSGPVISSLCTLESCLSSIDKS